MFWRACIQDVQLPVLSSEFLQLDLYFTTDIDNPQSKVTTILAPNKTIEELATESGIMLFPNDTNISSNTLFVVGIPVQLSNSSKSNGLLLFSRYTSFGMMNSIAKRTSTTALPFMISLKILNNYGMTWL